MATTTTDGILMVCDHVHDAHARYGSAAAAGLSVALTSLLDAPPVHVAGALGAAVRSAPIARPVEWLFMQGLAHLGPMLPAFGAAMLLYLLHSCTVGADLRRPHHDPRWRGRGRRLRRPWWRAR